MSLKTPAKIRTFQRKLYLKAKAEPDYRFYLLYDKAYREDILPITIKMPKPNPGAIKQRIGLCVHQIVYVINKRSPISTRGNKSQPRWQNKINANSLDNCSENAHKSRGLTL